MLDFASDLDAPLAAILAESPKRRNAQAALISTPTGSGYPPDDDPDDAAPGDDDEDGSTDD